MVRVCSLEGCDYTTDREEAKFCPKCGKKLISECPQCKTPLESKDDCYCINCGTCLKESNMITF